MSWNIPVFDAQGVLKDSRVGGGDPPEWDGKTPHYINADVVGGADDGSTWTNAWSDLPATLVRDEVYYVADGSYSNYEFNDADSGTLRIYVVKAIAADHGTDTGWVSTYGDGQATFTTGAGYAFQFANNCGYHTIHGQVGGGPAIWGTGSDDDGSSYGFHCESTNTGSDKMFRMNSGTTSTNNTFKHIDLDFSASDDLTFPSPAGTGTQDGFFALANCSDTLISHCRFNSCGRTGLKTTATWDNFTVEYCFFRDCTIGTHAGMHGEIWSGQGAFSNIIFRYNYVNTDRGSGSTGGLIIGTCAGLYVYGNIWFDCGQSNGIISNFSARPDTTDVIVNNNTFIDCDIRIGFSSMTDVTSRNNVVYNSTLTSWQGTHDYSASDISLSESNQQTLVADPFVDSAATLPDVHLTAALDAGETLASPYTEDPEGNTRGADGTWDRGAFEYEE